MILVRATDQAGNVGKPAKVKFKVVRRGGRSATPDSPLRAHRRNRGVSTSFPRT